MSKQWLVLPEKHPNTCKILTSCPLPTPHQRQINEFLAKLRKIKFPNEGLNAISHALGHPSEHQSGGSKSRRLCAIVIVGLIAAGGAVLTKNAVHESLIISGLLPELCGTAFLERLAHDFVVGQVGGVLTCDQKASLWRHSANTILGIITGAGIGPRMIISNFKEAVNQVEHLIDEWRDGVVPPVPGRRGRGASSHSSRSKSRGKARSKSRGRKSGSKSRSKSGSASSSASSTASSSKSRKKSGSASPKPAAAKKGAAAKTKKATAAKTKKATGAKQGQGKKQRARSRSRSRSRGRSRSRDRSRSRGRSRSRDRSRSRGRSRSRTAAKGATFADLLDPPERLRAPPFKFDRMKEMLKPASPKSKSGKTPPPGLQ